VEFSALGLPKRREVFFVFFGKQLQIFRRIVMASSSTKIGSRRLGLLGSGIQCIRTVETSGSILCVLWQAVTDFSKNRDRFIFLENWFNKTWTAWQWKSMHYDLPKRREVFAKWHTVSPLWHEILIYFTMFSADQITNRRTVWVVNDELKKIWKEAVVR
jgi:hypothetical protein